MKRHYVGLLAMAVVLAGCATVTRGTTSKVQVVTEPAGAKVSTTLGYDCTSPCTIMAGRKDEFTVTITKDGYEPEVVEVRTRSSQDGQGAVAGNLIAGGLIGMGVDAANGADLEHYPNPITVTLRPVAKPGRRS